MSIWTDICVRRAALWHLDCDGVLHFGENFKINFGEGCMKIMQYNTENPGRVSRSSTQ